MYFVKTRNWHCKRWVKLFLDLSEKWGVVRGDSYDDGDGKYILQTNSYKLALATWYYFMIFYHFSGGWTYINSEGKYIKNSDPNYPAVSSSYSLGN